VSDFYEELPRKEHDDRARLEDDAYHDRSEARHLAFLDRRDRELPVLTGPGSSAAGVTGIAAGAESVGERQGRQPGPVSTGLCAS
jgi:hypothetical protein